MTDHRVHDTNSQVVRLEAKPEPIAIETAKTAVLVVDMQQDFGAKGGMFDCADEFFKALAGPPTAAVPEPR